MKRRMLVHCKHFSGDTVLKDVGKDYKVDYRLGIYINGTFVDVSSIEVGRKPDPTKVKDDHLKIILESKTIINRIISPYSFINPSLFSVSSLQICGLKGDFISTCLQTEKSYCSSRVCSRVRSPLSPTDSKEMKTFIQCLILYKDRVEETAQFIKEQVNKAVDRRLSFNNALGPSFKSNLPNFRNWLQKVTSIEDTETTE
jgi:hypothetical protein